MNGQPPIPGRRKVSIVKFHEETAKRKEEEKRAGREFRKRMKLRFSRRVMFEEPLGDSEGDFENLAQDKSKILKRKEDMEMEAGE